MRIATLLVVAAILASGCVSEDEPTFEWTHEPRPVEAEPEMPPAKDLPPLQDPIPVPEAEPLRFLVIGDQGTGDENQYAVAETMAAVCAAQGCDFVIANGDNVYDVGAITEYDPAFDSKFETPYAQVNLPFYLTLGNHDNGFIGAVTALGDTQVKYTYREDRPSQMWNLPARFYSQAFGDVLEIFSLDTDTIDKDYAWANTSIVAGEVQQTWIRERIEASNATWKISFGHYNYISNGNYGDGNPSFKTALENSICDRVQFHLQGHDHDLQWLNPVESCGRTEFIVSGAAGKTRPDNDHGFEERFSTGDTLGFAWVEIIGESLRLQFIDVDQEVLFEQTVTKSELGW
ncbi:MAG: metallophosphoesterase [Thermoplasmatota archaeon]